MIAFAQSLVTFQAAYGNRPPPRQRWHEDGGCPRIGVWQSSCSDCDDRQDVRVFAFAPVADSLEDIILDKRAVLLQSAHLVRKLLKLSKADVVILRIQERPAAVRLTQPRRQTIDLSEPALGFGALFPQVLQLRLPTGALDGSSCEFQKVRAGQGRLKLGEAFARTLRET